jgi:hypothetical protein
VAIYSVLFDLGNDTELARKYHAELETDVIITLGSILEPKWKQVDKPKGKKPELKDLRVMPKINLDTVRRIAEIIVKNDVMEYVILTPGDDECLAQHIEATINGMLERW